MNNVDWRQILGVMKMKGENEGKIMFSGSENRNLGMRIATPSRERERERYTPYKHNPHKMNRPMWK